MPGWDFHPLDRASFPGAPDVSSLLPKIPYGGFSLGTAPKLACQIEPSLIPLRLSLLPAFPSRELGLPPPFVLSAAAWILRSVSEITCSVEHRHASNLRCSTPGALAPVRVMLSRPSTLNRPHPPRSRAHRNFTAQRLICDASAVREHLGHLRAGATSANCGTARALRSFPL